MIEFKSWQSYWHFQESVRSNSRYLHAPDVTDFLNAVRETAEPRIDNLKEGDHLWRAQLGCDTYETREGEEDIPYAEERMKPLAAKAKEGRANPKGIPYLYLATHKKTALSEVRPWPGSRISLGLFRIRRALKILDCTAADEKFTYHFSEPPPSVRELWVWKCINNAFARPVTPTDDVADYAPTQILAEVFKHAGFDGIAYRSALGNDGVNVVLFDIAVAQLVNCTVFVLKTLQFDFDDGGRGYSCSTDSKANDTH